MTIVVAVDTTADRAVVQEAATLADALNDELHVIHVSDRSDLEAADNNPERTALESVTEIARGIADDVRDDYVPIGRIGTPSTEIVNYSNEVDARYLVIGGRKRTPVGKALFGSVTQSILLGADRPVVATVSDR
jgi:nucleotide-binding universal stress UspA family protein